MKPVRTRDMETPAVKAHSGTKSTRRTIRRRSYKPAPSIRKTHRKVDTGDFVGLRFYREAHAAENVT